FETDNIEADGWEDDGSGIFAQEVQYRDYDVHRERISASLGFDFKVGDTTELFLRGLYSEFNDQEYRRRLTFDLGDFDDASSINGMAATFSAADERVQVERDIKDRYESQKIRSLTFGGETRSNGWLAEYSASWAKSSELEDGSVDPAEFRRRFDPDDNEDVVVSFDYSDMRLPMYSVSGANAGLFFDPSEYELNDIEFTELSDSQDEEYAAKFDLGREFYTDSGTFTVQGGFKGRWRDKSYNFNVSFWEHDDLTLADVLGAQTYRIAEIEPLPNYSGSTDFFLANMNDFEFQPVDSAFDSATSDYTVEEDVMAGYLLGRWDSATLRVIGGVRYEHTSNFMSGNDVLLVEEDGTLPGGGTATDDTVIVSGITYERDYEHWLPSLNLRWEAQDDLVVRLAGYRSLVRPKLSRLAPRFFVEQNDEDEREGEFGNPDLLPYEAWNFDASLEYYLSGNGAISGAVFYKDVKNFIVDTVVEDGTYRGIAFDEAVIPINGDSGEIFGFELGYSQAFTSLPEPFDGLLFQANYTYTDATGLIPTDGDPTDLREITLPSSAQNTFNAVLGYDKGPIDLRLSGTYRDSYLDEAGDEAEEDRIVDNHFQLDLSAKFRVTQNVQLFYEWININNAKYFAYNTFGGRRNLLQYEEYNWTMKFGARVNF
ncbi:MAG TPA: TonB-dependent receptor, partial [Sphingomonadaceae bacterium]|nr:TonB-dependent receptor [Sphingomonadaceae bacterium]